MLCDVITAKLLNDYRLEVVFEDNKRGIIDFSEYLSKGGVFEKFKDINFFRNFTVSKDLGTIIWGNEIDIAPETLYMKCEPGACRAKINPKPWDKDR